MRIVKMEQNLLKTIGKEEKAMRIGGTVKIKKCVPIPEMVGENAEIVDLQIQESDKYTAYPVWVKILSGERKGKTYGFQYDEVEMLPKVYGAQTVGSNIMGGTKTVKTKVAEQLEEILRDVTTVEEIAEIESVINEAKGKVLTEPALGFWEGKPPCWEMFHCPEAVKNECPAFKYRTLPCWQIEGTYCKLFDYGEKGDGIEICENCRVYKRYGHGERVAIKLRGKGFDTTMRET